MNRITKRLFNIVLVALLLASSLPVTALTAQAVPAAPGGKTWNLWQAAEGPTANITVAPPSADFGPVPVGSPSAPRTVMVNNIGSANLTVGSTNLTGPDAPMFLLQNNNVAGSTIIPGANATLQIVFNPASPGPRTATLSIFSNDPDENPVNITVNGSGGSPTGPNIIVGPPSPINFGPVPVGSPSAPRTVMVNNIGSANLTVGSTNLTGPDAPMFTLQNNNVSGSTIIPGANATLQIVFNPASPGPRMATLSIFSNDPDENPANITLNGEGQTSGGGGGGYQGPPSIQDTPPGMMIGPGMLFPALRFNLAANSTSTNLISVTVNILIPGGSAFNPTTALVPLSATDDRAGLTLFKDNKSAGGFGHLDPPQDFHDIYLPLASAPTWGQNGSTYSATLTLASPNALPVDDNGPNAGQDYFLVINTSSNPPPGATFQVQIPAGGIVLNASTFPPAATPQNPNVITIGQGGMMGSPVLISEIQTAGDNSTSDEFIELYNRSPNSVDLSTWSIQYWNGSSGNLSSSSPAVSYNLTGTISPDGYFLIANSDGYDGPKAASANYTSSLFALSAAGGTLFLVNEQTAVTSDVGPAIKDKVAWGGGRLYPEGMAAPAPPANGSLERKAFPDSTVASMTTGIDATMGNSFDSENNFSDFIVRGSANPQNHNDMESPNAAGNNPVVINEVYYAKTSTDHQWVELYNNSGSIEDLGGWKLKAAGSIYTFPPATGIQPGGFLVIHWGASGTNNGTNLYTGPLTLMSNLAGDVFLTDELDAPQDYVQYGAAGQVNQPAAAGAGQWPPGDYVPGVLQGQSIGRGNNGYDTNKSSDWQTFSPPTMGAPNSGGDAFAPDPVTNVTLADNDLMNFGLNGQDVTVSWTPASTPDQTFDKYVIYILPATTELDRVVHKPFALVYGGQNISSFTGSPGMIMDSTGNTTLANGSYKAHVVAVDRAMNKSAVASSSAATLTAEGSAQSGSDTQPPTIMSMPLSMAKEGSDIIVLAQVHDDRGLDETTPTQLKWRLSGAGPFNAVTGQPGGVFRYIIPWNGTWTTSTRIDYYLVAKDAAGNYTYFTTSPAFDTSPTSHNAGAETTAATFAFSVGIRPAANYNRIIAGTVFNAAGAALDGAGVAIPGSGLDFILTGASGNFSFTVPDGTYSVFALKMGYREGSIDGISVNAGTPASTGNNFYLSEGFSGGGGDAQKPRVLWTDPFDGMMGAPIDIRPGAAPIVAHMSKSMDSFTIMDNNAADAGSNVYLTTTGQDRFAGQVTYDESNPNDRKIIFSSTTPLLKGMRYFFVITPQVLDQGGNPIEGNQPDGRFVSEFTTFSDASGGNFGTGVAFPPFVMGSMPAPGSFNVPTNAKINVTFSEPMDPTTIETTNTTGLNVRIYDANYQGSGIGEYINLASVTLDAATRTIVTLTVSGNLTARHHYEIRVLGGAKSSKGIFIADPSQPGYTTRVVYQAGFDTGSGIDSKGPPQVMSTNLMMYSNSASGNITMAGTLANVPVNLGVIEIGFNKDINPATVTRDTITLKIGTTLVNGSLNYKPLERTATLSPSVALNPGATYTLRVVGGENGISDVVGGVGHYLESDYYAVFTTSNQADDQAPFVAFAKASDFKAVVSFSEPMNTAKITNTAQWPSSALNPANYTFYTDTAPPEQDPTGTPYSGNGVSNGNLGNAQGIALNYDSETFTVIIEGLQLPPMGGFRIWVNNATDLSNNLIAGNVTAPDIISAFGRNGAGGPIGNSSGGMTGPGGGGMTGPTGSGPNMGSLGMMPIGVFPMSIIAGANTTYRVDLPLTKAISANGTIVLTFPSGFDISGARNADPNGEWAHKDINGPGPGIVVLSSASESPLSGGLNNDGIRVNSSARTIAITLGSIGTAGYQTANSSDDRDFIHVEIAGIKNSSIAKSFETSGYSVDIQTMSGGSVLESLTSMPFFIMQAGQYSISGTVTFPNPVTTASGQPIHIFGGSPAVGPINIEVTFNNASSANYSITGLVRGDYMLMTDAVVTISGGVGDGDYFGSSTPEPIWLDDSTTTGNVFTKNFTFGTAAGRPGLAVDVTGDFTGENAGDIDVFAGSPQGFAVKTVTLTGNYTAGSPFSLTLYLPGNGDYMVGMGPAKPKGTTMSGPPPMPKWTPPPSVNVRYDGSNWRESSGTPDDGHILFRVGTGLVVPGYVYDGAGNPIPNTEVYAYSPMGMFGTRASSLPDGSFTLHLPEGMYKVGAFLPGMPSSVEFGVDVRTVGGLTKIYVDGVERASLVIKIAKPERTISGKVTDGTNTVSGASVFAYRTDGPGHAEAMTDSSGVYILYVTPGTWNIGAFLPGYGPLPEKTGIQVTTSDISNVNLYPDVDATYVKISGNVTIGGIVQTYIPIRAVEVAPDGSFTGYQNGASTDGNGNYSIRIKGTSSGEKHYRVDIWTPDYGEIAANSGAGVTHTPTRDQPWNVAVTTSDVSSVNIAVGATDLKTLTITFTGGSSSMRAYVDIMRIDPSTTPPQPLGMGRKLEVKDLSANATVNLPAGAYQAIAHIPGYGEFTPTQLQSPPFYLNLSSNATITFDLSGMGEATVTGTVRDGQGNPVAGAFVHIGNPQTGMDFGAPADSSGNFSLAVKAGTYLLGAEKPGYISEPVTITVTTGNNTRDLTMTKTSLTITGYVYSDNNTNGIYDTGEGLPAAFVHAEKLGGGFAGTAADPDGSYTLYVSSGDWKLFGVAEGYQEKAYASNPVAVGSSPVSGVNIKLSDTVSLRPPSAKPVRPASGGTFDDPNAGLKITVPPNALGSGTTDYQIQGKETSSLPSTPQAQPIGGKGKKVTVFDASGNPITTLNDSIVIEMTYTKADLVAAGFTSMDDVAKIKMAYWDDSASAYVTIPTTIAYDPSTSANWTNLVSVTFKGTTSHLTVFSPILPKDSLSPAAPSGLTATASSGQVQLTWTAPTTNADSSTLADLYGYEIYRSTSATGTFSQVNTSDVTTNSYTDTTVANGTTYYYKVTAADNGGNESTKSGVSNAATPTGPAGAGGAGGAGGGAAGGGAPAGGTVALSGFSGTLLINSQGQATAAATLDSSDGKLSLGIAFGTQMLGANSQPISSLTVEAAASSLAPPPQNTIVLAYNLGPNGATFGTPMTLTLKYDPSQLPAGVTETSLVISYWNGSAWENLPTTINAEANTASTPIGHFSVFALLAPVPAQAPSPAPTPAPPVTPLPTTQAPAPLPPNVPVTPPEKGVERVPQPASFAISGLSVSPATAGPAEEVGISTVVTNTGGSQGSYTLILLINGQEEARQEVILGPGESKTVTFATARDAADTYTVEIDGQTASFTVKAAGLRITLPLLIGIIIAVMVIAGVAWLLVRRRRSIA